MDGFETIRGMGTSSVQVLDFLVQLDVHLKGEVLISVQMNSVVLID